MSGSWRRAGRAAGVLAAAAASELALIRLGRTYGSTPVERATALPGDDLVPDPQVITDHAIMIDCPPADVWPWLVQMGWHRGGWYTARWVDRLLFPANWPSVNWIIPDLQDIGLGDFIPDGPPETQCGMIVEHLDSGHALALHSTSHLPRSWRERHRASLDWSWAFVLTPVDGGRRTRFHFRSRWTTAPWWFTLGGWLVVVPADFIMSRDMLHGIKQRAESLQADGSPHPSAESDRSGSRHARSGPLGQLARP